MPSNRIPSPTLPLPSRADVHADAQRTTSSSVGVATVDGSDSAPTVMGHSGNVAAGLDKLDGLSSVTKAAVDMLVSRNQGPRLNVMRLGLGDIFDTKRHIIDSVLGASHRGAKVEQTIGLSLGEIKEIDSKTLILKFENMDVSAVREAGIQPIAVFDFDKTLMNDDLFTEFMHVAVERKILKPEAKLGVIAELKKLIPDVKPKILAELDIHDIMSLVAGAYEAGALSGKDMFLTSVRALKGMRPAEMSALTQEMFEEGYNGKPPYKFNGFLDDTNNGLADNTKGVSVNSKASAADLVATLQEKGVNAYVITAGLSLLARIGAEYLGIDSTNVYGSDLETKDGKFTGRAPDMGEIGKDNLICEAIGIPPLFVFGDSLHTDAPMMRLATVRSFVVNAGDSFRQAIDRRGLDHVVLNYTK